MTPDRKECIAWLKAQGWKVYQRGGGWVFVAHGDKAIAFQSAAQAYRRLGGPDDGRVPPLRGGPSAGERKA